MKKRNRITSIIAVSVALITLLISLIAGVLGTIASSTFMPISGLLSYSWIVLVVVSIVFGVVFILQTVHEKQANKPDENKPTVATKSITIKASASLSYEPITIEVPDAKSAVEVWQGIHENLMKSENPLKAESQLTIEVKEPVKGLPEEPVSENLPSELNRLSNLHFKDDRLIEVDDQGQIEEGQGRTETKANEE